MADNQTISPADLRIDEQNPRLGEPNVGQHKALQGSRSFSGGSSWYWRPTSSSTTPIRPVSRS